MNVLHHLTLTASITLHKRLALLFAQLTSPEQVCGLSYMALSNQQVTYLYMSVPCHPFLQHSISILPPLSTPQGRGQMTNGVDVLMLSCIQSRWLQAQTMQLMGEATPRIYVMIPTQIVP